MVSQNLLMRISRNGYPLDMGALNSKFNFTISPITSLGVDIAPFHVVSEKLKKAIQRDDFSCSLDDVILVPVILGADAPSVKNSISLSKKRHACVIRRNIDFLLWSGMSKKKRISYVIDFVSDALEVLTPKVLNREDSARLRDLVTRSSL